jgi:hypothetical protein
MNAGGRLGLYGAGLAVAFAGAFGIGAAVVPGSVVSGWQKGAEMGEHGSTTHVAAEELRGVSLSAGGFVLTDVTAPTAVDVEGRLTFRIETAAGAAVTKFATTHEKELHLIVVRSDGQQFRHVHPRLDTATGTWSVPWQWDEAGTYRVFADFAAASNPDESLTLSRTVQVAGDFTPVPVGDPQRTANVDGYTVTLRGDLSSGAMSDLDLTVSKNGAPVTTLQPYLGAFGHLVALREGDLAYLHVHPEGAEPSAGDTGGPTVSFMAEVPTAGRYLLYLDFQVDGQVHTAPFVLDATRGSTSGQDGTQDGMDMGASHH